MARKFLNGNAETGPLTVTQPVTTTGAPVLQTLTGAANTGLTAATEVNDVYWNLSRTLTWATTAPTTQRAVYINATSLVYAAGTASQTITTAATLTINGAPGNGTNVTITTPLALWVESGNALFAGNVTGAGTFTQTFTSATTTALSADLTTSTFTGAAGSVILSGIEASLTATPSAASTATYIGVYSLVNVSSATTAYAAGASLIAGSFSPSFTTADTAGVTVLATLAGIQIAPSVGSTNTSGTNTVTNVYGINVVPGTWTASGGGGLTVTNYYGLYLGAPGLSTTTITNNYGVYQADTSASNVFAGTTTFSASVALSTMTSTATTVTSSGTVTLSAFSYTLAPPSTTSATAQGISSIVSSTNGHVQTSAALVGVVSTAELAPPTGTAVTLGTATGVQGIVTLVNINSTAVVNTITTAYGFYAQAQLTAGSLAGANAVIGTYYGLYLAAASTSGTGTSSITNNYGVYQQDPNATNVFAGSAHTFGLTTVTAGTLSHLGTGGIKTINAATQDGVQLLGRAGGTSNFFATITPGVLTGSITLTTPLASGTIATGTGASNQVAIWGGTNSLVGSASWVAATTSGALLLSLASGTSTAPTGTVGSNNTITFTGATLGGVNMMGIQGTMTLTPSGAASATYSSLYLNPTVSSQANTNNSGATLVTAYLTPTFFTANTSGAQVLTALYGLVVQQSIQTTNASGTNSIPTVAGVYVVPGTFSSTGGGGLTIANYYGIYLGSVGLTTMTITNNYGVYQADTNATNTFAGKVNLATVTASFAPINLGEATAGTVPTSPVNGDLWITDSGLFARINSSTVGPFSTGGGGVTIATGQIAYATGTNTLGGNAAFTQTTTSGAWLLTLASGTSTATAGTAAFSPNITYTGAATGNMVGQSMNVIGTPGGSATGNYIGLLSTASVSSAANVNAAGASIVAGYFNTSFATANTSGAAVLASLFGVYVTPSVTSTNATTTNTISNVYAINVTPGTFSSTGGGGLTIANYFGLFLGTLTLTTMTVTNRYGVYQQDPAATNVHAGSAHTFGLTTVTAGAISHLGTGGIKTIQAATQDGVQLLGRAGGTSSFFATITPGVLTASITLTTPLVSGTLTIGSGVANQVAYWSATNALTGSAGFTYTTTSGANLFVTAAGTSTATTATTAHSNTITYTGGAGSVSLIGLATTVTGTPGSASTATYMGASVAATITGAANTNASGAEIIGINCQATFSTSNTSGATVLGNLLALIAIPNIGSTNGSSTNTITNVYGIQVAPGTWTSSGGGGLTVTNYYGLYLNTVTLSTTTITNRYSIYNADASAKCYLGGNSFSVFGAAGSAQSTGWGTPAGPAVVATFPATPTLGQCGQAIGEIIVVMKALGFFGA